MKALILFAMVAAPLAAQLPAERTLAQIDRTFVCPESLPSAAAQHAATQLFVEQVMSLGKFSVDEIVKYRVGLLRKYGCKKTLANIASATRN